MDYDAWDRLAGLVYGDAGGLDLLAASMRAYVDRCCRLGR